MENTAQTLTILAPANDPHSFAAMCIEAEQEVEQPSIRMPLANEEKRMLEDNEKLIEQGINSWYEIGRALRFIKLGKLYRADYSSFEEYCRNRWGFGRHRGLQMIETSAAFGENVEKIQQIVPEKESHARILLELPDAAARQKVLCAVKKEAGTKPVTASRIKKAVDQHLGRNEKPNIVDAEILNEAAQVKQSSAVLVKANFLDQETNEQAIERLFGAIREYAGHKKWEPQFEKMLDELELRVERLKETQVSLAA